MTNFLIHENLLYEIGSYTIIIDFISVTFGGKFLNTF